MSENLILIDALFPACWEKKRKRRKKKKDLARGFLSPRARHALLAVLCDIFTALRCN
jgi:hypothetical protein